MKQQTNNLEKELTEFFAKTYKQAISERIKKGIREKKEKQKNA